MKGFTRPIPIVLANASLVPKENIISPAPNQFTHEVIRSTPYYVNDQHGKTKKAGELSAGTKVVILHRGKRYCQVVDGRGLYVAIACNSVRKL